MDGFNRRVLLLLNDYQPVVYTLMYTFVHLLLLWHSLSSWHENWKSKRTPFSSYFQYKQKKSHGIVMVTNPIGPHGNSKFHFSITMVLMCRKSMMDQRITTCYIHWGCRANALLSNWKNHYLSGGLNVGHVEHLRFSALFRCDSCGEQIDLTKIFTKARTLSAFIDFRFVSSMEPI